MKKTVKDGVHSLYDECCVSAASQVACGMSGIFDTRNRRRSCSHLSCLLIPDFSVIYCRSSKKQFSGQDFPQHRESVQSQTPSGRLSSWYSYSLLVDVSLCHLLFDREKIFLFFNCRIDFLKNNCILPSSDIRKYTPCIVRFSCWSDRWKKGFSNS